MLRLAQELSQGLAHEVPTRPHYLLCMTWAGWAWATPPPLKVYSECPEGRRSDCLLLPAHHKGWGLPGRSCAFWGGTWFSSAGTGMVGAGCPERGDRVGYGGTLPGAIFWSSQHQGVKTRSSIYLKITCDFLWAYITKILQVQFYYKFRPNLSVLGYPLSKGNVMLC